MSNVKRTLQRVLAAGCACALALSLSAPLAWADPADATEPDASAPAAVKVVPYEGTTYRVTVYGGNQGTVNGSDQYVLPRAYQYNELADDDLADLQVQLRDEASKYYVKGLRLAALDNERNDKNREQATADGDVQNTNIAGTVTQLYAVANAEGQLVTNTSLAVTEDTDLVVAYGIMANRVAYTVNYVDATTGEPLREPQTFFGDVGDVPATAPAYIENYLPDASLVVLTLSSDEAKNNITFRYTRLAEGTTTTLNPDGTVDVNVGGDTNPSTSGGNAQTGTGDNNAQGDDGNTAPAAYTTVVNDDEAAAAAAGETIADEATPLTTRNGTEVLADDGTPLAEPKVVRIEDDENALASGESLSGQAAEGANTDWIPWAVAAGVLACLLILVLVNARKKQDELE